MTRLFSSTSARAARPGGCALLALATLLAALGPLVPSPVRAEEPDARYLILPSVVASHGDPKHPGRVAAQALGSELRDHNVRAFETERVLALFEQRGSTPPMTASAADIDELAKDAQSALYHVASGLPQRAKKDVERALGRARKALESLNRETRAAQHLLDACLYLVRAYLQHGDRTQARTQALECRRLVPDIAPEPTMHPPDVIGVLAEAQAELRAHEPPVLRIESEPTGCAAYVNGRNLGPTPKELSQLSPGEYRLQVECEAGAMGRVHRIGLVRGRVVARIDTHYDRAIQTLFDLSLHYATKEHERDRIARDAVETGRIVGASDVIVARASATLTGAKSEVWLVRYRVADGLELVRTRITFDPSALLIAAAELSRARKELTELSDEQLARAAAASGKTREELPPEPVASATEEALHDPASEPEPAIEDSLEPSDDGPSALLIAGYVTGGLGLAAQVTSWVLYGRHLHLQSDYAAAVNSNPMPDMATTEELTALRDLGDAEGPPLVTGAIGAGLGTIALPMWLPESEGIPWWGYAVGGVGAALAITGVVLTAQAGDCLQDRYERCTEAALATDTGPMLLLTSVPLLAVPVVQAVRSLTKDRAAVSLRVSSRGGSLEVSGTW